MPQLLADALQLRRLAGAALFRADEATVHTVLPNFVNPAEALLPVVAVVSQDVVYHGQLVFHIRIEYQWVVGINGK